MPAPASPGLILGNRSRLDHVTQIAAWMGSENDEGLKKVARFALDGAIRKFNGWMWTFNRRTQNIVLANNDKDYALDTSWRAIMSANLSDANGNPEGWLPFKDFAAVEKDVPDFENSNTTGVPTFMTIISPETDAVLYVYPIPVTDSGAGRTLRLRFFTRIDIPTSDGESMAVPQSVDEAIHWRAVHTFLAMRGAAVKKIETAKKEADDQEAVALHEYQDFPDKDYLDNVLMIG